LQSVPAPHLSGLVPRRAGRRAALLVVVAAACTVALASALPIGHEHGPAPWAPPGVALVGGLPLQQARCEQWLGASQAERSRALNALHGVVGGPTPFGQATALTPPEAERLFDRTCSNGYARYFLLYELYTRASGFRSLVDPSGV
jgi:hypothetical protein